MMKKKYQILALTMVCCLAFQQNILGQALPTSKASTRIGKHEIGFNATFLVQEFFGTLDVNKLTNNTIFQYKWVKTPDTKWIPRAGLGGNLLVGLQKSNERVAYGGHLRIGLERRFWMHPKFAFLVGPDLLGSLDYRSIIITNPDAQSRNTDLNYRAGIAPFWGLMYRPTDYISLSLESSFVAFYQQDINVIDFVFGGDDLVFKSAEINAKYDYPINIYLQFRF